jgi:Dipeptidyl aminopeptidases/acylaminoacyl-peptidases
MNMFEALRQKKTGNQGQPQPSVVADTPITPETPFQVRNALQPTISPDGKEIAFLVGEWLPEQEKQRTRLWAVSASAPHEPRPLTRGTRQDIDPCWSPDSRYLAYSSRHEEAETTEKGERGTGQSQPKFQLHIMEYASGTEQQVCTTLTDARNIAWSPDGQQITFVAESKAAEEQDPIVFEDQQRPQRQLWRVYPHSDQPQAITAPELTIWSYAWSPDSQRIVVYYTTGPEETDWYRGQIGLVSAKGGAITQISQLTRQAWGLTWSPDGERIGYVSGEWSDPDRGGGDIYIYTLKDHQTRNLTPNLRWSPTWLQWSPDGQQILSVGWSKLTTRVALFDEASGQETTLEDTFLVGDKYIPRLSTSQDMQRIVTTHSEHHPYDVWIGDLPGIRAQKQNETKTGIDWQQRSRLNPIAEETLRIHPTEHIRYEGADGWPIEAVVTHPTQAPDKGLSPLIVSIHGGPSSLWLDDWDFYRSQILAEAGYVVLRPNIRGSMGRGVAFADAVIGDMGGKDFQDILKGIDYLTARKLVDSERVGIMGWSYGGFMTAWTVTQTQRFKAAVMGAGISDYHSFHAQTNIQDWDMRFLGTVQDPISPLTQPDIYRQCSPITYASRVQTPTLIVHGERDACVPLNQAYAFYRALKEQHVPTKLVIYPREGHGPTERKHQLDYTQNFLAWFKQYI